MQMQMERQNGWSDPDPTHGVKVPDIDCQLVSCIAADAERPGQLVGEILTELYRQDTFLFPPMFF